MKSQSTAIWLIVALLLAAAIWGWQRHAASLPPGVSTLLPGLHPEAVTTIQVVPQGGPVIAAALTAGRWQLTQPQPYPAQASALSALLAQLGQLIPVTRLTAAELGADQAANAGCGFDHPSFSLSLAAGAARWELIVGRRTAPGDQVYVRVAGMPGAYVTDAAWLQWLPRDANDWRDTSLADFSGDCNAIVITNGLKIIELQRDPSNQLWRMTRPLASRADGERITTALEQLRSTQVAKFVNDDPKADWTAYGLQPPGLALWFGDGTNLPAGVQLGKPVPETPGLVYARRAGWDSVLAVADDDFSAWRGTVNDFRDPHLLELTAPVTEIHVEGAAPFTLQATGSNAWQLAGGDFPVDAGSVNDFINLLAGLRIAAFVKDNNTATDLQGFGLDSAADTNQITLLAGAAGARRTLAQIRFGRADTNGVYVMRADENFVYALNPADGNQVRLLEHAWVFRDRRIWNFSETNVARIQVEQNGRTRTLLRLGVNQWSLGTDAQGIINPPELEETAHRLGELTALGWMGRNVPATQGGFNPGNLRLTVELKDGGKFTVAFGMEVPRAGTALAAVTLGQERWVFVFPPALYQFVATCLTIPPDGP